MGNAPKLPDFEKPPAKRIPAFKLGPNLVEWQTPTGRQRDVVWVEPEDVQRVLATFANQANALPIYRDHDKAQGAYGALTLEASPSGGIDQVWALNPAGQRLAAEGRYLYDSPEVLTVRDSAGRRRLSEIRSGSLVNEPARTGSQPLLMSTTNLDHKKAALMQALDALGGLEKAVKGLQDSTEAAVKAVGDALAPHLGPAIAALQGQAQQSEGMAMAAIPALLSPQAKDAASLGCEVLKMTGCSTSDEALGKLESDNAQLVKMSSLLVKLGVETGRLEAAEADKYAKYTPARLVARLNGSEALQMSAKTEQAPPTKKDAEPDDSIYDSAITAGRIGGK